MRWLLVLAILFAAPRVRAEPAYPIVVGSTVGVGAGFLTLGVVIPKKSSTTDTKISMSIVGIAIMTLGPPVVHLGYGHNGRAALSLGAHVLFPLLGAGIGEAGQRRGSGIVLGFLLGVAAATIIDVAWAASDSDTASTPRVLSFGGRF